jgi:hypothetical protein
MKLLLILTAVCCLFLLICWFFMTLAEKMRGRASRRLRRSAIKKYYRIHDNARLAKITIVDDHSHG